MNHQLDPVDIAILREAVRLNGLTDVAAGRINVSSTQVAQLEQHSLLSQDSTRRMWVATPAGRRAINA